MFDYLLSVVCLHCEILYICVYDFPKLIYSHNTYYNHRTTNHCVFVCVSWLNIIIITALLTIVYFNVFVCVMVEYYLHVSVLYGLHLTAGKRIFTHKECSLLLLDS